MFTPAYILTVIIKFLTVDFSGFFFLQWQPQTDEAGLDLIRAGEGEATVFSAQNDLYVAANCVTLEASQEQCLYVIILRLSLYFHLTAVLT